MTDGARRGIGTNSRARTVRAAEGSVPTNSSCKRAHGGTIDDAAAQLSGHFRRDHTTACAAAFAPDHTQPLRRRRVKAEVGQELRQLCFGGGRGFAECDQALLQLGAASLVLGELWPKLAAELGCAGDSLDGAQVVAELVAAIFLLIALAVRSPALGIGGERARCC